MSEYTVYKCTEALPMPGRYVLAHYCGGNWNASAPENGQNWKVAALVVNDWDRTSNPDKEPYKFSEFGPGDFKPDYIDMWADLPLVGTR